MKRFLVVLFLLIGLIVAGLALTGFLLRSPRPTGQTGPAAEALAKKMATAINLPAWDSTRLVHWSVFGHEFLWDKYRNLLQLHKGKQEILLDMTTQTGRVWEKNNELSGEKAKKELKSAWSIFCNDSFWFIAPTKVFDGGVTRSIVKDKKGVDQLMVAYASGGVTPGDAYLWILDENGRPVAWKIWAKVLPIGGLKVPWAEWKQLSTGAWVSERRGGKFGFSIKDVKSGQSFQAIGLAGDPFERLKK